jgi:uncharacterized protein (DUF1501 family)
MVTRRVVVKAGACALVGLGSVPRFLVRAAHAAPTRGKVLVAVFQRGAVDGLGMVPPHGDPGYAPVRPTTALRPPARADAERAIDLDGYFALHPALAPLVPLWQARSLAIVHACGSPDATRSHFDAQDYMETGTPGVRSTADGWLGRALGTLPPRSSPFRAVALGPRVPRALRGAAGAVAMASIGDFELHAGASATRRAFEAVYTDAGRESLQATGRETFEAIDMLRRSGASRLAAANGAQYPRGPFGESMRQIAQLIRADVGLEIAFADMGGFDTHAAQGAELGLLARRLTVFGATLAAFARDLGDRWNDVVVLTMSEFGRTVAENGAAGTDHGHATAMLVLGGRVRGGTVYGRWPGLAREQLFDGRDLAVTTDFRTLFAEVALGHLGVPASAAIFPGFTPGTALGLVS